MSEVDLIIRAKKIFTCRTSGPKRKEEMRDLGIIENGAIVIKKGRIVDVDNFKVIKDKWESLLFLEEDGFILPGLVDPHTHPLFGGSRVDEFILRGKGATYQEIHEKGGGILSTVRATRNTTSQELMKRCEKYLRKMIIHGTTSMEVKSGYGLNEDEEIRILRILNKLKEKFDLSITFLGAHAFPPEIEKEKYIEMIIGMLPGVLKENLAEFVDVFCENSAFSLSDTERILKEAKKLGFGVKIHSEEFSYKGSAVLGVNLGATSVDHLLFLPESSFSYFTGSDTVAVLLPGTSFFLGIDYAKARGLIDSGAIVALGTDFNPGSSFTFSMPMIMALGVLKMKMLPEEVINAATVNSSFALRRLHEIGSIEEGKKADLIVIDGEDVREWVYQFGVNSVKKVIKEGKILWESVI